MKNLVVFNEGNPMGIPVLGNKVTIDSRNRVISWSKVSDLDSDGDPKKESGFKSFTFTRLELNGVTVDL